MTTETNLTRVLRETVQKRAGSINRAARLSGFDQPTLHRIVRGETPAGMKRLRRLALGLELDAPEWRRWLEAKVADGAHPKILEEPLEAESDGAPEVARPVGPATFRAVAGGRARAALPDRGDPTSGAPAAPAAPRPATGGVGAEPSQRALVRPLRPESRYVTVEELEAREDRLVERFREEMQKVLDGRPAYPYMRATNRLHRRDDCTTRFTPRRPPTNDARHHA